MKFIQDSWESCMFAELHDHLGHNVKMVWYGEKENPANIAIECEDCCKVLLDFDNPGTEDDND